MFSHAEGFWDSRFWPCFNRTFSSYWHATVYFKGKCRKELLREKGESSLLWFYSILLKIKRDPAFESISHVAGLENCRQSGLLRNSTKEWRGSFKYILLVAFAWAPTITVFGRENVLIHMVSCSPTWVDVENTHSQSTCIYGRVKWLLLKLKYEQKHVCHL